jgi:hypothetical protein
MDAIVRFLHHLLMVAEIALMKVVEVIQEEL